jgi:predicted Zn-dependent protease
MMKNLLLAGALLAPLTSAAQSAGDLFRLGTNLATIAGGGSASPDQTPPTQFSWEAPAPSPARAEQENQRARRALDNLKTLIRQNPDSASLLVMRAQLYGRLGEGKKAYADLQAAQQKGSREPLLNLYLAQAALMSEQGAQAETYLRQQRTLTPQRPEPDILEARLWLARPGLVSQNSKQALLVLEKAVALDSTNLTARLLRGYTYYATNKYAAAVRDYRAVLAREPTHERAHFYLGQALVAAGQAPAACEHFRRGEAFAASECRWYLKKYCR